MTSKNAIIIVSGGMDSTTLLHQVASNYINSGYSPNCLMAVSFDYGQRLSKELECATWQCKQLNIEHRILDVKSLALQMFAGSALTGAVDVPDVQDVMGDPQPVTYVPNRNLLFLEIATAIAETRHCENVFYGAQKHDVYGYWDTTPDFLERVNAVHDLNRKSHVDVIAPFIDMSKAEILKLNIDNHLGVDYGHTWSCYKGGEKACGKCATCAERLKAFKDVGIKDPLSYKTDEVDGSVFE